MSTTNADQAAEQRSASSSAEEVMASSPTIQVPDDDSKQGGFTPGMMTPAMQSLAIRDISGVLFRT